MKAEGKMEVVPDWWDSCAVLRVKISLNLPGFRQTSGENFDVYLQNVKAQSEAFRSNSE